MSWTDWTACGVCVLIGWTAGCIGSERRIQRLASYVEAAFLAGSDYALERRELLRAAGLDPKTDQRAAVQFIERLRAMRRSEA